MLKVYDSTVDNLVLLQLPHKFLTKHAWDWEYFFIPEKKAESIHKKKLNKDTNIITICDEVSNEKSKKKKKTAIQKTLFVIFFCKIFSTYVKIK